MNKAGVIGAGTMGIGIAQVAASAGWNVTVLEINSEVALKAKLSLQKTLETLETKGKILPGAAVEIINRISFVSRIEELADRNLIIEAIVENLQIKKDIFYSLSQIVTPDCILASNTSSLSIASIAAACTNPQRCIGIHFFNPAPLMKLVEIIPAVQTSEEIYLRAETILKSWGKITVKAKDTPGFIVNRVARPFYGEALRIYDEGIADFATIDYAMKSLGNFPMGPFELMDFIGNDINYTVTETVFQSFFGDPRYTPSFTQKRMMEAGFLGRKTGQGYYTYTNNIDRPEPNKDPELLKSIYERILVMLMNEAADALHFGIASKEDIDTAMQRGVNYPKGLLAWVDEFGSDRVVEKLDELFDYYRETRYRCSVQLRRWKR
jgi:3-hydroxybutyryl-CoA dehydrogenase